MEVHGFRKELFFIYPPMVMRAFAWCGSMDRLAAVDFIQRLQQPVLPQRRH